MTRRSLLSAALAALVAPILAALSGTRLRFYGPSTAFWLAWAEDRHGRCLGFLDRRLRFHPFRASSLWPSERPQTIPLLGI